MAKKGQTFRKYTKEEKFKVIEYAQKTSVREASKIHGVQTGTISR